MSIIDKHQSLRACLSDVIDYINGTLQHTLGNTNDAAISVSELDSSLQSNLSFLESMPEIEFGYSDVGTIPAGSSVTKHVTFANVKAEAPCFIPVAYQNGDGKVFAKVKYTTTTEAVVVLFNIGDDQATNVTFDWVSFAGR